MGITSHGILVRLALLIQSQTEIIYRRQAQGNGWLPEIKTVGARRENVTSNPGTRIACLRRATLDTLTCGS
ncbi:hypothetical protein F5Y07DRAFT_349669 [Xylaria sp. FL0933]|nr:hypothetical protein F5Y07DRAFT_349669 [Xylaria sp. FL0933]